jgi:hypothetical protein
MKSKIILFTIITLFISVKLFAQDSYQTFASEGFKIKCGCNLHVNNTLMQIAKQNSNNTLSAFIGAENQDSPEIAVIVYVNVIDESQRYNSIQPTGHAYFEKKYLEQYASSLSNAGMSYNYTTYQGVSALEYSFEFSGIPTKAIMFLKHHKSYMLQVGTRKGLNAKFSALKSNFQIF